MKLLGGYAVLVGALFLRDGVLIVQAANSTTATAAAANCATVTIRTAEEADAIRKKCPVIHGNLTIESSKDSPAFLDLTGIEVVEGMFSTDCEKMPGPTMPDIEGMPGFGMCSGMFNSSERVQVTIEALTLREIKGRFTLSGWMPLKNFTAPELKSVGEYMYITGMSLEYLDLSSLEEVGHMSISNSGVREIKHGQLKRILGSKTGRTTEISMYGLPNLKSVDSWVSGPVSVQRIDIDQAAADMTELTIGALHVDEVVINGKGNLALTFGTDDTKEMNLGKVQIRGLSDVKRNEKAENIKVGTFDVQHNEFSRLDIPFDDLGMLYMMYESKLETLTLPRAATKYTNLTVAIWDCEKLDLKSEFVKGKNGEQRERGWYWPERDMGRIAIYNTSVDETLFKSLIKYRMDIPDPAARPKIQSIDLWPPAKEKGELDCTELKALQTAGVVEDHVVCDEFSSMSRGVPPLRASMGMILGAVIGVRMALVWI